MQKAKTRNLRYYLKWTIWVLAIQIILINISASVYAYKFTHFYNAPAPAYSPHNIFIKTWKLFVGPKFYKDTSEPEPSFAYEPVQLKTSGGISIDAWYSKTGSSTGCVILVHGYSVNKSYCAYEAAMFKQMGYSVLLFDLRGHGKSGGNTTSLGMKEADELQNAFEFAKQKGNSRIILVGGSLGAVVCINATAEGRVHPDALIAEAPFGSLHEHLKGRARTLGFPAEPFASLTTFWIGIEKGYNGFDLDMACCAKKITCPLLLEWGSKDPIVTKEEIDGIFKNLSSKNKKLVVYPDAGHANFLQKDPLSWENRVQAFLKSVP
jgi:alpha-beta hydrolase superfamily lysophospholipase